MNQHNFEVTTTQRLDVFLASMLNQPRNQVNSLIKDSHVKVDNKVQTKNGLKLKASQNVQVNLPKLVPAIAKEVDFDIEIIYEDNDILVLNKPANLVVHPAPSVKEPTLVDWLRFKGISLSTLSAQERHGIVHRLDKGTSGAIVVAKNNVAHEKLSKQLQDKSMGRYYIAMIDNKLKDNVIVEKPIARNPNNRLKMGIVDGGKDAKTSFISLIQSHDTQNEIIACKLFTGRTHQIRVHLSSIGRHIVGDDLYGFKSQKDRILPIFLHAYIMYLIHPSTGELMRFIAPIRDELNTYFTKHFELESLNAVTSPDFIIRSFTT